MLITDGILYRGGPFDGATGIPQTAAMPINQKRWPGHYERTDNVTPIGLRIYQWIPADQEDTP